MKLTPIEKRAERMSRNKQGLDMNLVSLIDIFTILIFFLMSSAAGVEILNTSKAVRPPESISDKLPQETVVIVVAGDDILVDGRRVAGVAEALSVADDLIAPVKAELDLIAQRQAVRKENEAKGRTVTILGDKDIPYRLLRKVMVSAALANFTDVSFAVTRKAGKA